MKLSWVEKLSLMKSISRISKILLENHEGKFLDPDLGIIREVNCSELPDDCYNAFEESGLANLERKFDVVVRSIPVSRMFVDVPEEFILGYTMGLQCFVDGREVDVRVYAMDYKDYPDVKDLLQYVKRGEKRSVSFKNFTNKSGILWLHMEEGFVESSFDEDGRKDISDVDRVSPETLRIMEWADTITEEVSELYILRNEELDVAYVLPKENGEFSVLVY
mgnify:FL=1